MNLDIPTKEQASEDAFVAAEMITGIVNRVGGNPLRMIDVLSLMVASTIVTSTLTKNPADQIDALAEARKGFDIVSKLIMSRIERMVDTTFNEQFPPEVEEALAKLRGMTKA